MARSDLLRSLATQEVRRRQASEEAWWFGDGPKAGAVPAADMRVVAQSTRDADAADLVCFAMHGDPASRRSVYQRVTPARDVTIGFVELALTAEMDDPYRWVQVSLYGETAGLPAVLLGRCVPIPIPALPRSSANTDTYLLPLWEPVQVAADTPVWVGLSPKAYSAAGDYAIEAANAKVLARGNRVDTGEADFISAAYPDVEPPLTNYTFHDDEHLWVRLYEDAEALVKAARIGGISPPARAMGVRSVMARPVGGRVDSRYQAEIRPGHATVPWNAGSQTATGGGGGLSGLNIQRTRVALEAGQAEYTLPWTPLSVLSLTVRNLCPVYGLDYTITANTIELLGSWVPQESEGWIEVVAII